jgi:LacI family transcriptional regulator
LVKLVEPAIRHRPATLTDVAKLAGVSIATASKALNGRGEVSAATRARVQEAAEQLSFSPNSLARSLLAGRTGTIGLITNDLEGRFSIPVLMGAEDAAGEGAVSVFLCDARGDDIREQYHMKALLGRRVDGLIVVGSSTNPRKPLRGKLAVPVVYAYAPSESEQDISVVADNFLAGRMAIEHLLSIGRSRIAHITGDRSFIAAQDRAKGAVAALAEAGYGVSGGNALFGSWSESWGRTATAVALDRDPQLDAIFCGSDQIARGALDLLRERKLSVPQDVAVIGFDNWAILATNARPQLTSIDMQLQQLGRLAAQLLFSAMDGRPEPGIRRIGCALVVRESTVA